MSKSKIDFSNSKSKAATKKPNSRATSLMAQRRCQKCKSAIFGKNGVEGPDGSVYHPNCFRCADCEKEMVTGKWRSYPIQKKGKKRSMLTLCTGCANKRDESLFSQHKG